MRQDSWPEIRIGDLGEVFTGRTPPTEHSVYFGDDYPFITPGDSAKESMPERHNEVFRMRARNY